MSSILEASIVEASIVEASIADLRRALDTGALTAVELAAACLTRIGRYDRSGILLNSVPVINPDVLVEARASDERRHAGTTLGPLDGIPYTAKDSYAVKGLAVAAGSPAFADLIAGDDAHAISALRGAGAVLIGLTNMPPMANGGMQRGLFGRAESPYNAGFLTSALGSGSSNGSGTATAASFAVFGLAEETWSSGRAPASNNGLVAYTPSRGVISVRGNWPLVPTMDVVVPHTRSIADMLEVLDVLVADDPHTDGDFWRSQPWVEVPLASSLKQEPFVGLTDPAALQGKRIGVPRMYIGKDLESRTPIHTRESVIDLWREAEEVLTSLGATVVEVGFPVVSNYEADREGAATMVDRGYVPPGFADREIWDLAIWAWDAFLRANGDPSIGDLASVRSELISPLPKDALPDRYGHTAFDIGEYVARAQEGVTHFLEIPDIAEGVRGLEKTRRIDFEDWLSELQLDAVVFPAVADIGPADADTAVASADIAWRNGTWVANGNLVPRHLGIPTVTVPMGLLSDIGMPVGLTFAGAGWDDRNLLQLASAYALASPGRVSPPRTPALPTDQIGAAWPTRDRAAVDVDLRCRTDDVANTVWLEVTSLADGDATASVTVNGIEVEVEREANRFFATVAVEPAPRHSEWVEPYGPLVVAVIRYADGRVGTAFSAN